MPSISGGAQRRPLHAVVMRHWGCMQKALHLRPSLRAVIDRLSQLPFIPQPNRGLDKRVAVHLVPASMMSVTEQVILLVCTYEVTL
jgi:hypothetical protein